MLTLLDRVSGECVGVVESTDGYDMGALEVGPDLPGRVDEWRWSPAEFRWVPRPASPAEETAAALEADPRWQALRTASPSQVSAWIDVNVTDLASARRVLVLLVLGLQRLARSRSEAPPAAL